jgi:CDP-4-dehydro-6-deoxyglucose reductase
MNIQPAQHTARIAAIEDIAPDIRILRLEMADGARLHFKPGQYVFIAAPGQEPRAFSIASPPEDPLIELHVRSAGHGISAHAMALKAGDALTVRGPLGTNILREGSGPLLVLAGGIGIAPMKSIVESRLQQKDESPLHLYWGVRDRSQLYLDGLFRDLARRYPHFHYRPVPQDEKGFIGAALAADLADLSSFSVYLAGPKPMIDATTPLLLEKGARRDHIFSDAFSA